MGPAWVKMSHILQTGAGAQRSSHVTPGRVAPPAWAKRSSGGVASHGTFKKHWLVEEAVYKRLLQTLQIKIKTNGWAGRRRDRRGHIVLFLFCLLFLETFFSPHQHLILLTEQVGVSLLQCVTGERLRRQCPRCKWREDHAAATASFRVIPVMATLLWQQESKREKEREIVYISKNIPISTSVTKNKRWITHRFVLGKQCCFVASARLDCFSPSRSNWPTNAVLRCFRAVRRRVG